MKYALNKHLTQIQPLKWLGFLRQPNRPIRVTTVLSCQINNQAAIAQLLFLRFLDAVVLALVLSLEAALEADVAEVLAADDEVRRVVFLGAGASVGSAAWVTGSSGSAGGSAATLCRVRRGLRVEVEVVLSFLNLKK